MAFPLREASHEFIRNDAASENRGSTTCATQQPIGKQHQQRNSSAVQSELSDLRPQATAQRQLQDTANNSPQSHQLNAFQQMAQNSARATQLKAMSAMMNAPAVQRVEEEKPLQAKSATETAQRDVADAAEAPKPNNTGLPDNLKSGIESLSGMSMDHVKVHYNSSQPAN
jgi:FKBP-type peptidyl-prolyl cis-trans isomerase